ncbi:putative Acyl carrier protein [Xenorhabdus bovienii str. oregonense]|uniref:Putative Acyl carrier protein n=1 Tax=Xenorhabdus bovienii str. oregonense TaxID=1398202 RepID=A0A077P4E6_XENBV|nr:phosphopantetheine-binding protein [Xenorhabdus bovienii]CDH05453.1 putative Acyl carrier protein [Xenorhabdus bovienii str. oregonense]
MLEVFNQVKEVIINEVKFIFIQASIRDESNILIDEHSNLIDDLAFTSLMIARLIMELNEKLKVEPFDSEYHFSDIKNIKDIINAYINTLNL